jgi:hypothetical protein
MEMIALVRRALCGALFVLLLGVCAPSVSAHFKQDTHNWWFGGNTLESSEDEAPKVDPVNMFFYPNVETKGDIDQHFNDHWQRRGYDWIEDQNLPGPSQGPAAKCKGDHWVNFRAKPPYKRFLKNDTDFHGAGVRRSEGKCANRYHIRFWGDAFHEDVSRVTHGIEDAWVVAGAHYEDTVEADEGQLGHQPERDWDRVEHRITQIMRPHSYHFRWRCLPNSWGPYGGYRSDGRITRIGNNHGNLKGTKDGPGKC